MTEAPNLQYNNEIQKHETALTTLNKKRNLLAWLRLIVFIATVIVSFKVFVATGAWGMIPAIVGFGIFIYLVLTDAANNEAIANLKTLIDINREELRILNNDFSGRDDGEDLDPELHPYAADLDLFGKASVFQWGSRCFSDQGRILFAHNLLSPLNTQAIKERQEAVRELAPKLHWRQQLQSYSKQTTLTSRTEEKTLTWLTEQEKHFVSPEWKSFVWTYTIITLGTAAAAIMGFIPGSIFLFLYAVFFTTAIILSRNTIGAYLQLTRIVEEITTLQKLVTWIETESFEAPLLQRMKNGIGPEHENASARISELKSILDKFDMRLNLLGPLFLNAFLLWDIRQMMALNAWRRKNKNVIPKLFELIAQTEVLNSLAAIHFNHPNWCLPQFNEQHFAFESTALGHPLIPEAERIASDFTIGTDQLISLVTGSNMAGKSTFLRSIGVNAVLAQMGAPVCAKTFIMSPVQLMTSMRISDNLAENTSTFYAELKKLKTIIEAVNRHEKVFVLLDEILRGTNSHDRHTGSAALIRQLIRQHAFAVIATHDLELAGLEKEFPAAIENYHFDVQVKGEELFFDYKLKHGVCHSLNASLLMKKIGIELEQ